jgi:hypothetical protein
MLARGATCHMLARGARKSQEQMVQLYKMKYYIDLRITVLPSILLSANGWLKKPIGWDIGSRQPDLNLGKRRSKQY